MRKASAFLGSLAALAIMTAPVLAKSSTAPPAEDKSAPSQCHSLQQGPGGVWIEIPCQEVGSPAPAPPRPPGRSAETVSH
jgi:hypothetical protein